MHGSAAASLPASSTHLSRKQRSSLRLSASWPSGAVLLTRESCKQHALRASAVQHPDAVADLCSTRAINTTRNGGQFRRKTPISAARAGQRPHRVAVCHTHTLASGHGLRRSRGCSPITTASQESGRLHLTHLTAATGRYLAIASRLRCSQEWHVQRRRRNKSTKERESWYHGPSEVS